MTLRREAYWLLAAVLFGAAALPFLVYSTGLVTLGPYSRGGAFQFYGDFLADLARLHWSAWTLLLGPVAFVIVWRLMAAYAWRKESE